MSFKNKYLKYKTKYLELKKQVGGFSELTFLGMGAENVAFRMSDGKILRVRKGCEKLDEIEKVVVRRLEEVKPKYFALVRSVGKCSDLKGKNLSTATTMCNAVGGEVCDYDYVIMDDAPGTNFSVFFLQQFENLITRDDFDEQIVQSVTKDKIADFSRRSSEYIQKIIVGLMDANSKLGNYKHCDLNYRNCHISESFVPTIFDYGASKIGANLPQCSDILEYLRSILADPNLEEAVYKSLFPTWSDDSFGGARRNKIIKNFRAVRKQFRLNKVFTNLINGYYRFATRIDGDKGEIFLMYDDDTKPRSLTLESLQKLINGWM